MNRIIAKSHNIINIYKTSNAREIADYLEIDINYKDFKNKKTGSCLIKNYNDHFSIFLKNGLNNKYENFLIAHEIGHYILHHD